MAQKIKFSIIQSLFHLFSFLADKTNGLDMFVKPKILFGSVIIGLTATACSSKTTKTTEKEEIPEVLCYEPAPPDSINEEKDSVALVYTGREPVVPVISCYLIEEPPVVSCYDTIEPPPQPKVEIDSNYVYTFVKEMPSFPGGEKEMIKFIYSHFVYPASSQETAPQGKVICRFIVEKDGSISNVEIKKGVESDLDKEAVRVIESMPNWEPGKQDGELVRVYFYLPVQIHLQ